jgi:hypothetical protein
MNRIEELEAIVKRSLTAFTEHVDATRWYGKEREMVSYYAFGFLLKECRAGSVLFNPAQIAIESRVRQIDGPNMKRQVCKDLCIWSEPGQNCWDEERKSTIAPLLIMEWKYNTSKVFAYDLDWLEQYSLGRERFIGLCVSLDLRNDAVRLNSTVVRNGISTTDWLMR